MGLVTKVILRGLSWAAAKRATKRNVLSEEPQRRMVMTIAVAT